MWYLYNASVLNGYEDEKVLDTFDSLEAGLEYLSNIEGATSADWMYMAIRKGNFVLTDKKFA